MSSEMSSELKNWGQQRGPTVFSTSKYDLRKDGNFKKVSIYTSQKNEEAEQHNRLLASKSSQELGQMAVKEVLDKLKQEISKEKQEISCKVQSRLQNSIPKDWSPARRKNFLDKSQAIVHAVEQFVEGAEELIHKHCADLDATQSDNLVKYIRLLTTPMLEFLRTPNLLFFTDGTFSHKLMLAKSSLEEALDFVPTSFGEKNDAGRVILGILHALLIPFALIVDLGQVILSLIQGSCVEKSATVWCVKNTYRLFHTKQGFVHKKASEMLDVCEELNREAGLFRVD